MTYNVSADYMTDTFLASVESPDVTPIRAVESSNPVPGRKATVPLRLYRQLLTELEMEQTETQRLSSLNRTLQSEFDKLWKQHDALLKLLGDRPEPPADELDEAEPEVQPEADLAELFAEQPVTLKPAPIKPSWVKVEPPAASISYAAKTPEISISPATQDVEIPAPENITLPKSENIPSPETAPTEENVAKAPSPSSPSLAKIPPTLDIGSPGLDASPKGDIATPHAALNFLTALRQKERDRQQPDTALEPPLPPVPPRHLAARSTSAPKPTLKQKAEPLENVEPEEKVAVQTPHIGDRLPIEPATVAVEPPTPLEPRSSFVRAVSTAPPHLTPPVVRPALRVAPERSRSFAPRTDALRREPDIEDLSQYDSSFPKAAPTRESSASMLMGVAGACLLLCVAFGAGFLLVQPVIQRIEATPPESAPEFVPETEAAD